MQKKPKGEKTVDNTGSINVSLPSLDMVPPSQLDAYIIVARDLLQGVEALSSVHNIHPSVMSSL